MIETTYPNSQPFRLRFNGAKVQKQIAAHYQGGLEGDLAAFYGKFSADGETWVRNTHFTEKVAIQLGAPDPFWYEVGESAALLDTNDSATFRTVAARLRSTGQWSALGPPNAAGSYTQVFAVAEDGTYIYFGGDFLNFDNIANADNIVRYNKQTGVYSALDVGLNDTVRSIAIAPNGDVYIGGDFINAGGVAAADYLIRWDGSAFNAVGTPVSGAAAINGVYALAFNHVGNLFIGGDFANWSDIAAADNAVMWNGSAYSALSTGLNGRVEDFAVDKDNLLYLAGLFSTAGGTTVNFFTSWNGSAFANLANGFNTLCSALAVGPDNRVYVGGDFTTANLATVSVSRIAVWNGTAISPLGSGVNNQVHVIVVDANGNVLVGGTFSSAGGIALNDSLARWNGYAWAHFDIDLPGSTISRAIKIGNYDPVNKQIYDLWVGFQGNDVSNFGGLVVATNEGSVPVYPKIIYYRSGGTSAIIETLKNERTGKELLFNYSLLNNETLIIDLTPTNKSIISSFFGDRLDAVLANSDFGSWSLLKGDNDVTSFVATVGSPTVSAYMLWRESYSSY